MQRKVLALMLAAVMVCSMAACGKDAADNDKVSTEAFADTPAEKKESEPENTEDPDASTEAGREQNGTEESSGELTGNQSFAISLPEGFVNTEENNMYYGGPYYGPDYPDKCSNIIMGANKDHEYLEYLADATTEQLVADVEQQIEATYGFDVSIELLEDKIYKLNGYNAHFYEILCEAQGKTPVYQMQVIVETPEICYLVTYTDMDGGEYLDAFRASADTVRFE